MLNHLLFCSSIKEHVWRATDLVWDIPSLKLHLQKGNPLEIFPFFWKLLPKMNCTSNRSKIQKFNHHSKRPWIQSSLDLCDDQETKFPVGGIITNVNCHTRNWKHKLFLNSKVQSILTACENRFLTDESQTTEKLWICYIWGIIYLSTDFRFWYRMSDEDSYQCAHLMSPDVTRMHWTSAKINIKSTRVLKFVTCTPD